MSQAEKSAYYQELKAAGVTFDKEYRRYSTEELAAAVTKLRSDPNYVPPAAPVPSPRPAPLPQYGTPPVSREEAKAFTTLAEQAGVRDGNPQYGTSHEAPFPSEQDAFDPAAMRAAWNQAASGAPALPVLPPAQDAGLQQNITGDEEPFRTDENGLIWYKDEVRKPSYPKPRKRRIQRYIDTGAKTVTAKDGQFTETFEVAGDERREAEVRVTLPSYQVGLYLDPRFPWRIHVYNENRGFDLFDVQKTYGGAEMVPAEIKRKYVENVLCYDMPSVVRAIETEARQLDLLAMRGR